MQTLHLLASLTRASADARAHSLTRSWQSSLSFADSHTYIYSLSLSLGMGSCPRLCRGEGAVTHTCTHTVSHTHTRTVSHLLRVPIPSPAAYTRCTAPRNLPVSLHAQAPTHPHSLSHDHSLSLTLTHTHTLCLSLSHIRARKHICRHTYMRKRRRTRTLSHTITVFRRKPGRSSLAHSGYESQSLLFCRMSAW